MVQTMRTRYRTRRDPAAIEAAARAVVELRGQDKHEAALVLADMIEETGYPAAAGVPIGRSGPPMPFNVYSYKGDDDLSREFAVDVMFPTQEVLVNVPEYREIVTSRRGAPPAGMLYTRLRLVPDAAYAIAAKFARTPDIVIQAIDSRGTSLRVVNLRTGKGILNIAVDRDFFRPSPTYISAFPRAPAGYRSANRPTPPRILGRRAT